MPKENGVAAPDGSNLQKKRPRQPPVSDSKYPRKRSLKACHVCRARKTKCDNVQPTCGFCASLGIRCSYDASENDHSAFDPASLEILRQLSLISKSQDDLLHLVQSSISPKSQYDVPGLASPETANGINHASDAAGSRERNRLSAEIPQGWHPILSKSEWAGQRVESVITTPASSTGAAATKWFDLLTNDDALPESELSGGLEKGLIGTRVNQEVDSMTPLQRATRMIDAEPPQDLQNGVSPASTRTEMHEKTLWQASRDIKLLDREQTMFENFLHRICPWLDLFDPDRTFSAKVPRLAVRNAGLLNAILALSCYRALGADPAACPDAAPCQNLALQYYYQTLHYVRSAMRYSTYQGSEELMATTLVISTYEMLRGSRQDWQQHLQGVFWILRSRQIEVEQSSLESTIWWAWLRQDIWAAFREKRRTYSTWTPKKAYPDLSSHEIASRSVWILAQVINFCAVDPMREQANEGYAERVNWANTLKRMLDEWESHLTMEFSPLISTSRNESEAFTPHLVHPQCFGLAVQVHHVSRILIAAHEPCAGGIEKFMERRKAIKFSAEIVCGLGMTLTEDASSMLSSQCVFIAGLFIEDSRQRAYILEILEGCRSKCAWPTSSLGSELTQIWDNPDVLWGSLGIGQ